MSTTGTLNVGSPITVLWTSAGDSRSWQGVVQKLSPLTVECKTDQAPGMSSGDAMKLLFQENGRFQTGDAELASCTFLNGRLTFTFDAVTWVRADRRSHPRFAARLQTECRFVVESSGNTEIKTFTVTTNDISVGGVWVKSDYAPPAGSILHLSIHTEPETYVKALGVVAWVDPNGNGFGVEFIDVAGGSFQTLTRYIRGLAA